MKRIARWLPGLVLALALGGPSLAQQQPRVPSHCKPGEFALLNANLSKVVRPRSGPVSYSLVKTGKVVSICADRKKEPFRSVTYRYGAPGQVELETTATAAKPFSLYSRSTTPHSGENLIFFRHHGYTYSISEATGMGSGIGLIVFRTGKKLLDLFSGTSRGTDFNAQLSAVDFERSHSPVFKVSKPADMF